MTKKLHIATYNIHKGFSHFKQRMVIHELRDKLRTLGADVVFLQEVQGDHSRHPTRFSNWPSTPQYEFLADSVWEEFAYGKNASYDQGHHGNAILSRFPIVRWENQDISTHRFESRGLLHCELQIPEWDTPLHCINVHLALHARGRRAQLLALCDRIQRVVPDNEPLIIAGDFNDWRTETDVLLHSKLNMAEVFHTVTGHYARSFPATLPLLRLDRIYIRGFKVERAEVLHGLPWSRISDHAALSAHMVRSETIVRADDKANTP